MAGRTRLAWLAALLLAIFAAYANSLQGPFVFDDGSAIPENPTIRDLKQIGLILSPPKDSGVTVNGRPLVNLSFALNYAAGDISVRGYHLANIALHAVTALVLFGFARRAFRTAPVARFAGPNADQLALVLTILWALHPLQTQSVAYIVQRAEALVAFFYVAMLYALHRGVESNRTGWLGFSWLACLLGMASKEVMVSAPVIAFLYDGIFLAGSFREAWRRRWGLYLGYAATWLLLGWLVASTGNRGGTAGFGSPMPWWQHALVQCWAIPRYVWLSVFPSRLVFDYGYGRNVLQCLSTPWIVAGGLLVAAAFGATIVALLRRTAIGFVGIAFFAILSPSSSIVPILTEPIAEHRMYLPLAAVVGVLLCALHHAIGRRAIAALLLGGVALAVTTQARNRVYASEFALWSDTVAKMPCSARGHDALAGALKKAKRLPEALAHVEEALRILPDFIDGRLNRGLILVDQGQVAAGIQDLEAAVTLDPRRAISYNALGSAYYTAGQLAPAMAAFEKTLALQPTHAHAHNNLGVALRDQGKIEEAIVHYRAALAAQPFYADALYNLGSALGAQGREAEAANYYREALKQEPDHVEALNNLAIILIGKGDVAAAVPLLEHATTVTPLNADAQNSLGVALMKLGRTAEAEARFSAALQARPDFPQARANLRLAREAGRPPTQPK